MRVCERGYKNDGKRKGSVSSRKGSASTPIFSEMALVFVLMAVLGAATVALGGDCRSQPEVGLCDALIPRYFYNASSGQCQFFNYGGCGGNQNNYKTLSECEDSCLHLTLEDCSAEPETGFCRGYFPRQHFDIKTGTCKQFIYGGCGGNKNNFGGEEECNERCGKYAQEKELTLEECTASPDAGLCKAYIPSYYFNQRTGVCEQFVYGGCGGNVNRFSDQDTCQSKCGKYAALPDPTPEPEVLCSAEPEVGLCKAAIPRYFWNHRLGVCQPFIYGGCGGNSNNFESSNSCHDACQGTPVKAADCSAQPESGLCMAYFPSFFFNTTSGQCDRFVYGGCGGNGNRFQTVTACQATCGQAIPLVDESPAVSVCAQPKVIGPCKAAFPRYYYDASTKSCQKFTYGGCRGNANNFEKLEDCHSTCEA